MGTKISIRLDARKHICLVYGSNGTKINLAQVLELKDFQPKDFVCPIKGNTPKLLDDDVSFFVFDGISQRLIKNYTHNNKALIQFYNKCVEAISKNSFETGKELVNHVTGNTPAKVNISLSDFVGYVIDLYKYDNPNNNPNANTYQLFITLRNKLCLWDNGKHMKRNIDSLNNSDFINFGNWIKETLNGANYFNLMKNFRRVINLAIKESAKTGCTEKNKFTYSFNSKENQPKCTLSDLELMEQTKMNALTDEQINKIFAFDVTKLDCLRGNKGTMLKDQYKAVLLDIAQFMYEGAMRPFDVIRLTTEKMNIEKRYFAYMPRKVERFRNAGTTIRKMHTFIVDMTQTMYEIFKRNAGNTGNLFVFNVPCNINEKYNYALINKVEADANILLKSIADRLHIPNAEKITLYTLRTSKITSLINHGINPNKVALMAGTSAKMIWEHYYQYNTKESTDERLNEFD